ncbi:hypothetical protein, partial [Pedobacter sp. R20-19]|uniref:hypothetical protein n=1 Tax=Pedobacter sp. R20-19 TaxID=1270196 RepID=UPI0004939E9A
RSKYYVGYTSNLEERLKQIILIIRVLLGTQATGKLFGHNLLLKNLMLLKEKNKSKAERADG